MKRLIFCLLLCLLVLSACTESGGSSGSGTDHESVFITRETLAYPEELTDEAKNTSVYEQAVEQGAILLGNVGDQYMPATTGSSARDFLDLARSGEAVTLPIYRASWEGTYIRYDLVAQEGKIHPEVFYWDDERQALMQTSESDSIRYDALTQVELNSYGYMVLCQTDNEIPWGFKVVHDRELYEDYDELHEIYERYISPVLYAGVFSDSWESAETLGGYMFIFEDLYNHTYGHSLWDGEYKPQGESYEVVIPFVDFKELVTQYFAVSDTVLRQSKFYNAADDSFHYEGGRGGGPACIRVLEVEKEGEETLIGATWFQYTTGEPTVAFQVRIGPDGRYQSVTVSQEES